MPDRCTPEYERVVAAMGAALPYRRALALLEEFFPLGDVPAAETMRQRTLQVGARLERATLAPPQPTTGLPEASSIALGIDAGHVRSVRSFQVRSFEVFVAQVSGDEGRSVVFSSVPAEADRQQQQLRGVLHRLGATPSTPVTILSDGADGPRSLGEAACIGPTSHVLDWFHSNASKRPETPSSVEVELSDHHGISALHRADRLNVLHRRAFGLRL
jgi:hypothetical protein